MASEVPPAYTSRSSSSAWPRAWLSFEEYQVVHARYMDVLYRDAFVESDTLSFTRFVEDGEVVQVRLDGTIYCSDDVSIEVTKYMDVRLQDGVLQVLSTYYRYHAFRPARGGTPLIRYDCAHGHPHYHRFDPNGAQIREADLTFEQMPRLDEVVREAVDLARERDGLPG